MAIHNLVLILLPIKLKLKLKRALPLLTSHSLVVYNKQKTLAPPNSVTLFIKIYFIEGLESFKGVGEVVVYIEWG